MNIEVWQKLKIAGDFMWRYCGHHYRQSWLSAMDRDEWNFIEPSTPPEEVLWIVSKPRATKEEVNYCITTAIRVLEEKQEFNKIKILEKI